MTRHKANALGGIGMSDKYVQHDGYDKFRNANSDGSTKNSGKASYDDDGTLRRLDVISPAKNQPGYHVHEWLKKDDKESYEYGQGLHKNH